MTRSTGRIRALLALGGVLGLGAVSTLASWTDDATATAQFTSGTIDLALDGAQGNPDPYKLTSLTVDDFKPGDSRAATLPVQNAGTLPFTYRMTVSAATANTLSKSLTVTVTTGSVSGSGNHSSCNGETILETAKVSGSPVLERSTSIPPSQDETLCLEIGLAATTPNDAQGQSTSVDFAFRATTP